MMEQQLMLWSMDNLLQILGSYVSASGFGTYVPSISGTNINLDFKAHTGVACTVNTIVVGLSSEAFVGVDTNGLKHVNIESRTTGIASTSSPEYTQLVNIYH